MGCDFKVQDSFLRTHLCYTLLRYQVESARAAELDFHPESWSPGPEADIQVYTFKPKKPYHPQVGVGSRQ